MTFSENTPQRRRRRRRSDPVSEIPSATTELVSPPLENQEQTNFSSIPNIDNNSNEIDQIAAELSQESAYPITDSNFSDDSHNWNSESEPNSEEYWHFLGSYE